jgi:hypothetical protein
MFNNPPIWHSSSVLISGTCFICMKPNINMVAHCSHGFHYNCLIKNLRNNKNNCYLCPFCNQNDSFSELRIYCNKCLMEYQIYNHTSDVLNIKNIKNIKNN